VKVGVVRMKLRRGERKSEKGDKKHEKTRMKFGMGRKAGKENEIFGGKEKIKKRENAKK